MEKFNLMDVDFIIPVRIDSIVRVENLLASVALIEKYFHTNIYVLEAAGVNNHIVERMLPRDVSYSFVTDWDPVFHRTKYLNLLSSQGMGKYISIWDADVIIDSCQIVDAVNLLRNGTADVVFPYDGHFYDTTEIVRSVFLEKSDISILKENMGKMQQPYGLNMGGGAIFISREKFEEAGGEDESFYGWGQEDWNRMEKWEKLDYQIRRTGGPLFHLTHPRDLNGKMDELWRKRYAGNLLRRTQNSSVREVKEMVVPQNGREERFVGKDKLHIGCGRCLLSSWVNTDIEPCSEKVLYLDITKPLPFADSSFKYVFSEHVCEHISIDDFLSALQEIRRVLKIGGIFRVAMPVVDFLLELCNSPMDEANSKYINWSIGCFASSKVQGLHLKPKGKSVVVMNNFMRNWGHQFIYSTQMIESLLLESGFKNVRKCQLGVSTHKELCGLEQHGTQIPQWANEKETVVFEAEK